MRLATKRQPSASNLMRSCDAASPCTNADVHYPKVERIRVVLDNLSTHAADALYEAFPACRARRVLERPGFYYVPKRANWLTMIEIAIGVLCGQCLNCRIGATVSDPKSSPGNDSECRTHPHQIDIHNRQGSRKNGPRLSPPIRYPAPQTQRVIITVQGW